MTRGLRNFSLTACMALLGCGVPNGATQETASASFKTLSEDDCRQDLKCWSAKHKASALSRCRDLLVLPNDIVEKVYEPDERAFETIRWHKKPAGPIFYSWDQVRAQRKSGKWLTYRWHCVYDPDHDLVVDMLARLLKSKSGFKA